MIYSCLSTILPVSCVNTPGSAVVKLDGRDKNVLVHENLLVAVPVCPISLDMLPHARFFLYVFCRVACRRFVESDTVYFRN